jgi:hypothetical protein
MPTYLAEVHQKVERFLESEALSTLMILSLCCSYSSGAGGLPGRGAPEGGTLPGIRGPFYSHDSFPLLQLFLQSRMPTYLAEVHQKVERFLESEGLSTLMTLSFVAAIPPEQEAYLTEVHQKVERS